MTEALAQKYAFDFKHFQPDSVSSEDEAFALLLGFEPKAWSRYQSLLPLEEGSPRPERRKKDEKFFREYGGFLKGEYGEYAPYNLTEAYRFTRTLGVWSGDFRDYVQALHDSGLIFKSEIYSKLKELGIVPAYSECSRVRLYYQQRAKDGLWSLDLVVKLYLGYARDGQKIFYILDQRERPISDKLICDTQPYQYLDRLGKPGYVSEFVKEHVNARTDIETFNGSFRPKEITKFLRQYFPDTYRLEVLFEVLGLSTTQESSDLRALTHSGLPGRPSAKNLYLAEFRRRQEKGLTEEKITKESKALHHWFKVHYPDLPCSSVRAIEANIRQEYNAAKQRSA